MFFQGQKSFLIVLLFAVSLTGISQYKVREIKCLQDKDIVFPSFSNLNKASTKNINEYLQKEFFGTSIYQTSEAGLFDESILFNNDSSLQSGYTSIAYKIELNDPRTLSVIFEVESMGAYPTSYYQYFSFNARTGDVIHPDDLFTATGIDTLKKYLIEKRKKEIKRWIDELRSDNGNVFKEDSSFIFETFEDCNRNADEKNIFIRKGKILFYKEDCFSHAWAPLNTDLDIELTYKELEKYLSLYGKKLLLSK